jgi:hypothetical protein
MIIYYSPRSGLYALIKQWEEEGMPVAWEAYYTYASSAAIRSRISSVPCLAYLPSSIYISSDTYLISDFVLFTCACPVPIPNSHEFPVESVLASIHTYPYALSSLLYPPTLRSGGIRTSTRLRLTVANLVPTLLRPAHYPYSCVLGTKRTAFKCIESALDLSTYLPR